jgi:hypothetical protein
MHGRGRLVFRFRPEGASLVFRICGVVTLGLVAACGGTSSPAMKGGGAAGTGAAGSAATGTGGSGAGGSTASGGAGSSAAGVGGAGAAGSGGAGSAGTAGASGGGGSGAAGGSGTAGAGGTTPRDGGTDAPATTGGSTKPAIANIVQTNGDGSMGTGTFTPDAMGFITLTLTLKNCQNGAHAFHLDLKPDCGNDGLSAGDHWVPKGEGLGELTCGGGNGGMGTATYKTPSSGYWTIGTNVPRATSSCARS